MLGIIILIIINTPLIAINREFDSFFNIGDIIIQTPKKCKIPNTINTSLSIIYVTQVIPIATRKTINPLLKLFRLKAVLIPDTIINNGENKTLDKARIPPS
jgi:hypothetical protein